ncbi:hypothetical protein [Streptomyces sp. NPDC020298]|uniref:hypothetical protein n=1 Tax=unclassified Streptomyces TaxID=2593676 RepID=UPI0033EEFCBD
MPYIPEMVYSKRGEFSELAKHIEYAQNTKHLPGKHGTNKYLTRLTDKAKIKKDWNTVPVQPAPAYGQGVRRVPVRLHLAGCVHR